MKVAVLVGGRGTRLKPITNKTPKALVSVAGAPFLKIILTQLKGRQAVLLAHYRAGMIADYCTQNKKELGTPKVVYEVLPLGTGGTLGYFSEDKTPVVVMNGDTYVDIPFSKLAAFHKQKKADVTILSFVGDRAARGSVLYDDTQRVTGFGEKTSSMDGAFSTGVYIINPSAIRWLLKRLPLAFSMEKEGFPLLIKEKRVFTYVSSGEFFDIGTHKALRAFRRRNHV